MKCPRIILMGLLFGLGTFRLWANEDKLKYKKFSGGAIQELGQAWNAISRWRDTVNTFTINRTGAWFIQEANINERLKIAFGLGGVFFYSFPDIGFFDAGIVKRSAVSVAQASGTYTWGDLDDPILNLTAGFFPYKYNPDSRNLGEYLFRSTSYPNTVNTGVWDIVNNSRAALLGFKLNTSFFDNSLNLDLMLTSHDVEVPLYDISITPIVTYTLPGGLFEIAGAINFDRVVQLRPSQTNPEKNVNSYFIWQDGKNYYGDPKYNTELMKYWKGLKENAQLKADELTAAGNLTQAAVFLLDSARFEINELEQLAIRDSIGCWTGQTFGCTDRVSRSYYSFQNTKLMGRMTINPQTLFASEFLSPNDLKLYAEIVVLGWKNYPVFYENRKDRTPIMVGFNLPTFNILDLLAIEVEYWSNPWINSVENVRGTRLPLPTREGRGFIPDYHVDDFKWSILSKKEVFKGFNVMLQIANDHMKPIAENYNPTDYAILNQKDSWYFATRFEVGI